MTLFELRQSVLHLGLVNSFDDSALDSSFPDAATRALNEVSRLCPRPSRAVISHFPIPPLSEPVSFSHDEEERFSINGCASFCFYISGGQGTLTVKVGDRSVTLTVNGAPRTLVRYIVRDLIPTGAVRNDVELIFTGDYIYNVSELTFFGSLTSQGVGAIHPPSDGECYDMKLIVSDFLRFSRSPVISADDAEEYRIEGSCIWFPQNAVRGDYTVIYDHKPVPVTVDTDEEAELDCDDELCDLLPLITAFYVWLDDMPDKAQIFYQRYTEAAAIIKSTRRASSRRKYKSSNGWD